MAAFPGVGDTLGRYEIVRRIGRGGMGTVFEARQVDLGRAVALKVLSPELAEDPDFRARFAREARMLAGLDSPHIIQVYDTGEQQGEFYIATQLVQGRDLLQLLRQGGPLAPATALRIAGQVASALGDAHDAGVLHRDVKPSNVLIRESRADFFAYLCDFGIARHTDSTHTRTGGVLGTLSYLAPECHDGGEASVRSDLYSLGCVLWAALTGRAPFERTSEYQVALAHMHEEIPVYPGGSPVATEINVILRRAMAKSPSDRYESAGAMHASLIQVEETARGLHRGGADSTAFRSLQGSDKTQLRVAQTAGSSAGGANGSRVAHGTGSARRFAAWAAALLLVVGLGGVAVALLGARDAGDSSAAPPASRESTTPQTKSRASGATKPAKPQASSDETTEASAKPAATDAALEVVCWDSSAATSSRECPPPSGRRGLETVFPSLDDACGAVGTQGVSGKAEVYECRYGAYMIRYSRWVKGADRYSYLNSANPNALHPPWTFKGVFYGRAWVSFEDSPTENMKYQWSATYRGNPYSVSVEGVDDAARRVGIGRVVAAPPGRIGLP